MLPERALSRESTDSVFAEIDDDAEAAAGLQSRHRFLTCRFTGYVLGCLTAALGTSGLCVGLWSDMGCGTKFLKFMQEHEAYAIHCATVVVTLIAILYMLDFFAPAHLPGRYCVLFDSRAFLGRCCLALAVLAAVSWVYLSANRFPTLPLVITFMFSPMLIVLLRRVTMPVVPERPVSFAAVRSLEDRIALIKLLGWEEKDEKNFYTAAMYSFAVAGLACVAVWIPWAFTYEETFNAALVAATTADDRELLFVRWASPTFIAVSNFVCAGFAGLRVSQNGAYSATDHIKNQLVFDFKSSTQRHMQYRIAWLRARVVAAHNQEELVKTTRDQLQHYLVQHISATRKLSKIVKAVGLTIIALILALHIVFQMTASVNHTAIMVEGFLAEYLIIFAVFIFVSFNRVSRKMSVELMDLPLVKNISSCTRATWARALLLCLALPLVPFVLAVSFLNQALRKCRGIAKSSSLLTDRVNAALEHMASWCWPDIIKWCYIMAAVLMIFRMSPIFLNVLLAWMNWVMSDLNFWLICGATFAMGSFLFMLPPVPGPIIYPFAGIVMSDPNKCPFGFWGGCIISIVVSFVMKMTACTLQQKGIGEQLGGHVSIRRAVGIHTAPIRAIENVLKQPGLSVGKCMILCGGPDWPTSVLAGILRLSLWQCLLGTCPIILSIVPMALTGSFYLKRNESEVWLRTGNLMLFLTTLVSAVFLVGIGWAIQDEYDKRGDEINKPKEVFVELEWLDYRSRRAAEKCKVGWSDIPRFLKAWYTTGAVMATLAGHLLMWFTGRCFGTFQLTDDIETLVWFGRPGALIQPLGLVGLAVGVLSYSGFVGFSTWRKRRIRVPLQKVLAELDAHEAEWKEEWLRATRAANRPIERPRRSLTNSPTLLLTAKSNATMKPARSFFSEFGKTPRNGASTKRLPPKPKDDVVVQTAVGTTSRLLSLAAHALRAVRTAARREPQARSTDGSAEGSAAVRATPDTPVEPGDACEDDVFTLDVCDDGTVPPDVYTEDSRFTVSL